MKRYIILICAAVVSWSRSWASDYATLGDFLATYVDHLDDDIPDSYKYIDVYFTNITPQDKLYPILQKAIYLDLIENLRKPLNHNLLITQTSLAQVMSAHRGQEIERSSAHITKKHLQTVVDGLPTYRAYFCGSEVPTYTIDVSDFALTKVENFPIMDDVYRKLTTSYLYHSSLQDRDLIAGAIKGMVEVVGDEYTTYFVPSESESYQQSMNNEYTGIGVVVESVDEGLLIVSPFRGSPAQQAGLQPEDIITHVDGVQIASEGKLATKRILGPKGTSVALTILRNGRQLEINVMRATVQISMVSDKLLPNNDYYIMLSSFGYGSAQEMKKAIQRAKESKAHKLIIDLRHNPGGSVQELESMLNMFLPPKLPTFTMRGEGYEHQYMTDSDASALENMDIVILVDSGSASAAEMLALILQDYGRATIVGEQTFGKGTAQSMTDYGDGSSFKFTVFEWFSSHSNTSINALGVQPDHIISGDNTNFVNGYDNQLEYAKSL